MKKLLLLLLGVVAVAFLWAVYNIKHCKQPDANQVFTASLDCALELARNPDIREQACQEIKHQSNCQFDVNDFPAIKAFVHRTGVECTKKKMSETGFCTDKVEDLLKDL